jgi:hypothetical protein
MANIIPSHFNSLELTVPIPSWFEKWTRIGNMFGSKWRPIIPSNFYPISMIAIGSDITGTLTMPNVNQILGVANLTSAAGALQYLMQSAAQAYYYTVRIELTRKKSAGYFVDAVYNYYSSPRLGLQLGSQFKNQAYISVKGDGIANINTISVDWIRFDTIYQIEYAINCRFKKLYIAHGKILNVNKKFSDVYCIKIYEKNEYPNLKFKLDGKMWIWVVIDDKYKKIEFDLSKNITLSEESELIFEKSIFPEIENVGNGDFFVLEKPWVAEDPTTLFEYGLNKDDGFYQTQDQKTKPESSFKMTIRGIWLQEEFIINDKKTTLWHVYSDLNSSQFVLPVTEDQEEEVGEYKDVGLFKDGLNLLKEKISSGSLQTIRVTVFGATMQTQNFAADCLRGEFIKIQSSSDDYYFEIVGHPRQETIEVNINCANANTNISEVMDFETNTTPELLATIDVFQQSFWFINELYYGYPYYHGLWEGAIIETPTINTNNKTTINNKITKGEKQGKQTITTTTAYINATGESVSETYSVNYNSVDLKDTEQDETIDVPFTTTTFKISSKEVISTEILGQKEKSETSCNYLSERFHNQFTLMESNTFNKNQLCDNYYKKYNNWYFYNISKNKQYEIIDINFKVVKTEFGINTIDITIVVNGDVKSELNIETTTGYVFLDEPYKTYSGYHGEMTAYGGVYPSVNISNQSNALLYGNYYAGTYYLPEETSAPIYVNSSAYGRMIGETDIPDVLVSSYGGKNAFVSGCVQKIGENRRDYIFFSDPEKRWIISRQGSCAWRKEHQRKLVIMTEPEEFKSSDITTLQKTNKIIVKMIYNTENSGEAYWFVSPKSQLQPPSLYESYYISSGANASSDLVIFYGLENTPSKGVYFPFEFFSFENKTENRTVNQVAINTYFTSDLLNSGECISKIYDANISAKKTLISVLNGLPVAMRNLSFTIDKILGVDQNMVLQNIDYMWSYSTMDSAILLFYNMSPPEFYSPDAGNIADLNPTRPSVFVLRSDNSGDDFHSPASLERNKALARAPLMILYDFDLRCAAINQEETTCYLFGFTYERGKGPEDKDSNGIPIDFSKYCFLAMYCFNLYDVFKKEDTYGFSTKDGTMGWIGRTPTLTATKSSANGSNEYGEFKNLFGKQLQETIGDGEIKDYDFKKETQSSQYLVSILNQTNASFEPEQISVSIDSSGNMTLFVNVSQFKYIDKNNKEQYVSGIIALSSKNGGVTWFIDLDSNGQPIIYSDHNLQTNPYILNSLLFVVDSLQNKLIVKNIENKLVQRTNVVASNVLSQNIYAVRKENGDIYVYYYSMSGSVLASCSKDNGINWQNLDNW